MSAEKLGHGNEQGRIGYRRNNQSCGAPGSGGAATADLTWKAVSCPCPDDPFYKQFGFVMKQSSKSDPPTRRGLACGRRFGLLEGVRKTF